MEKNTAKELLSTYRQNGMDADDKNLKEALLLCQNDPEMKRWFESELAFDRNLSNAFNSIKGPEAGKKAILATALLEVETPKPSRLLVFKNAWTVAAAAAIIAITATLTLQLTNQDQPSEVALAQSPWLTSVSLLADAALPLDKRGDQIQPLQNWLAENDAPQASTLPASLTDATQLAGCRVFDLPNGKKASLICFIQDRQFVHVFVVRKSDLDGEQVKEQTWETQGDWNLFAWSEGDMLMTVASKLPAAHISPLLSRA